MYTNDFGELATIPRIDARTELDVSTIRKRIDALCGPRNDQEAAEWLGVDAKAVAALRQGRDMDVEDGDTLRVLANLAEATRASMDWILGRKDVVTWEK